jgi:hypothetical protein
VLGGGRNDKFVVTGTNDTRAALVARAARGDVGEAPPGEREVVAGDR